MRFQLFPSSFFSKFCLSLLTLSCTLLSANVVHAEKEDSQKPTIVEAERSSIDGKKKITTITGDVVMTRGTLLIKADQAVVTERADESHFSVLTAVKNSKVTFRQKRDGGKDLWVEGEADRVEYDEKLELVKFISRAKVRYLDGAKVTQEQEGEFMSYDSANDVFNTENTASGKYVPGGGRSKLTMPPKTEKSKE